MPAIRKATTELVKEKTKALGDGVVEVIVASNKRDRHGEILDIKGLNTKDYNGVVLWGHDMYSFPIGKTLSIKKTRDGQLIARAQLAVEEYDFAGTAYNLIKGGYISDVSIGFIPKQFNPENDTWEKSEMVEWSFVSIGANSEAKVSNKALEEVGLSKKEFDQQARDHMLKMKELENDEEIIDDDQEEDEPEPAFPKPDDEPDEPKVDKQEEIPNNIRQYIEVAKTAIADAEKALNNLPDTATDNSKTQTTKKRILIVQARKQFKMVDQVAELALGELKTRLKEADK